MTDPQSKDLLSRLQAKYPKHKVISEPDPDCICKGTGERKIKPTRLWPNGRESPCLCICLSGAGRAAAVRIVANAARKIKQEEFGE